jgi:putative transposase
MTGVGCCWDNAIAESFFSLLKEELVHLEVFATHEQAKTRIFECIEADYNRSRIHSTLGYKSPVRFEEDFMNKAA